MNEKEFQETAQPSDNTASKDERRNLSNISKDENMADINLSEVVTEENEIAICKAENEKLQTELNEQKDKYLRLFAEFDNYKRRNAKERIELVQTAGRDIITSMLDVLDDCDRAERVLNTSEDIKAIREGVQLVFNKLHTILQLKGLKPMESIKKEFNSDIHEAVSEISAPSEDLQGKVLDEVMKGYYLNDKIIRFAKVIVGK